MIGMLSGKIGIKPSPALRRRAGRIRPLSSVAKLGSAIGRCLGSKLAATLLVGRARGSNCAALEVGQHRGQQVGIVVRGGAPR
jgi:hypothetical protein